MKLSVVTPTEVVIDAALASSVLAEDETGCFGILPGHAQFVTVLSSCVVTWRDKDAEPHYVAVRGGVLSASASDTILISTREAVTGTDIDDLRKNVVSRFQRTVASSVERVRTDALHAAAMRQIMMFLNPDLRHVAGFTDGSSGSRPVS